MDSTFRSPLDELFSRFLQTLEMTERAAPLQVRRYQAGLLERLVRHARETVPFYRERLACLFKGDEVDLSRWSDVPLLTRDMVTAHREQMQSGSVPPEAGPVHEVSTTGTTGKPLRISFNAMNRIAAHAALARTARWWGIDTSRDMAKIVIYLNDDTVSYPAGREAHGWCLPHRNSRVYELDMFTPAQQQIEWLLRKKPSYLSTSPVNATALAYAISPSQARELDLKAILAYGETVLPHAREFVPKQFGAPLIAIYSCQEVGYIASQCPASTQYHVMTENILVEILRDDGTPAAPGEAGQVVLTGLYNYAMPFIRYAIGDVATPGAGPCACGRTLPLIAHIDGRTRHAFVFEDGTRVWPRLVTFDISPFVACREYQLVQIDYRRVELRYVPDETGRAPDVAGLDAYVRDRIHPSANVVLVPIKTIPKGPGGKYLPFFSMVE